MSKPRRSKSLWTHSTPALTPADFDSLTPEQKQSAISLLYKKQDRQIAAQQKIINGLRETNVALAAELSGLKKALRFAQSGIKLSAGQKD